MMLLMAQAKKLILVGSLIFVNSLFLVKTHKTLLISHMSSDYGKVYFLFGKFYGKV